jgi:hypothetical protein
MERQVWIWRCSIGLTTDNVLPQEAPPWPNPAPNVEIVRVRIAES